MRILVVSDIHSNWPALAALDEPFDLCLFLGDLVDYGPAPKPCIEWARQHVAIGIRGNHDHGLAQRIKPRGHTDYGYLAGETRELAWQQLNDDDLQYLARMPVTHASKIDGRSFYLVHATPRDPLDESVGADPEAWARRLGDIGADFVCVGHTHVPFVFDVNGTTVLNPGSLGQPRDGDCRASYAMIEDGRVELRRIEYPVDETIRLLNESPLPQRAKDIAIATLRRGGRGARSRYLAPRATPSRPIPKTTMATLPPEGNKNAVPATANLAVSRTEEQKHEEAIAPLKSQIENLRTELEALRDRERELTRQLETQQGLASQLETLCAELDELRASERELNARLEAQQKVDSERGQSLEALEREVAQLRSEKERLLAELYEQNERRAAMIQEKEVEEQAYARSIERRDSEIETLRADLDELREREKELTSQIEEQQEAYESAQTDLQTAIERLQDVLERFQTRGPTGPAGQTGWRFESAD